MVCDLALISGKIGFDDDSTLEMEIANCDLRFDELAPSLLSISSLHPVLVDFT